MKIQLLGWSLLLLVLSASVSAQTTVRGSVYVQATGEPIPFVNILNLHSKKGTTSSMQGNFTIEATNGKDSIQISCIGYHTQKVLAMEQLSIALVPTSVALSEIIVSANRTSESRTEIPAAISSISATQIEQNKPTTIDQVLNQSPGVNMVDLGNEQHTMSIRRPIDYGASYLYLEDGIPIRVSGVFNHNALLEINMANTNKIEIVRGPSSSFYGSEAIGGAVNFISKTPSLMPTAGLRLQGNNIGYRRVDFEASNTVTPKLGLRVSGYYANQKNGIIAHSDFNKIALSLGARYFISPSTSITWNSTIVDYYSDMSGSLDSAAFYNKAYESNQTFTNRNVQAFRSKIAMEKSWKGNSSSTATVYYRNNSVGQIPSYRVRDDFRPWLPDGDPNLAHGEKNKNAFESIGFLAQHKQDLGWKNSSIIVGANFDFSPNTYKANYLLIDKNEEGKYINYTETDSALANYTADLFNIASYVQYKVTPVKGVNLMVALRYDNYDYHFQNALDPNSYTAVSDGSNNFQRFTPKVGLTYEWKENKGFYANYSQGFVPPQVTELYKGQDIPLLDPVYYNSAEVGGWWTLFQSHLKLELSFYRMEGENEIISVLQNNGTTAKQNAGKTLHQGIEFGFRGKIGKTIQWHWNGTHAIHEFVDYKVGWFDYSGMDMPQAPAWLSNAQITYQPNFIKRLRASLEWQHVYAYYMDQKNTQPYSGYDIFNIRIGYQWNGFEFWSNVLNLNNSLYATVARANAWGQSYSLGKPRNITVGIGYRFQKNK